MMGQVPMNGDGHMRMKFLGIPTNMGAMFSGTELTPKLIREAKLLDKLERRGVEVIDLGDLKLPDYLPCHNTPPIRNYPGPRMVWESIASEKYQGLFAENDFTLIIGGDCSIIVGTVANLLEKYDENIHLIVLDAHVDDVAPTSEACIGAAAMGLWFLTQGNMIWNKRTIPGAKITVIGAQDYPKSNEEISVIPLIELRTAGIVKIAKDLLNNIPSHEKIFLHFDVDVLIDRDMPCAYSPSSEGLLLTECILLLTSLLEDRRVIGMEVTELSGIKATNEDVGKLVNIIVTALGQRDRKLVPQNGGVES